MPIEQAQENHSLEARISQAIDTLRNWDDTLVRTLAIELFNKGDINALQKLINELQGLLDSGKFGFHHAILIELISDLETLRDKYKPTPATTETNLGEVTPEVTATQPAELLTTPTIDTSQTPSIDNSKSTLVVSEPISEREKEKAVEVARTKLENEDKLADSLAELLTEIENNIGAGRSQIEQFINVTNTILPTENDLQASRAHLRKQQILLPFTLQRIQEHLKRQVGRVSSARLDILIALQTRAEAIQDLLRLFEEEFAEVDWLKNQSDLREILTFINNAQQEIDRVNLERNNDPARERPIFTIFIPNLVRIERLLTQAQQLGKLPAKGDNKPADYTENVQKFIDRGRMLYRTLLDTVVQLWIEQNSQYYPQLNANTPGTFVNELVTLEERRRGGGLDGLTVDELRQIRNRLTGLRTAAENELRQAFPQQASPQLVARIVSALNYWQRADELITFTNVRVGPQEEIETSTMAFNKEASGIRSRLQRLREAESAFAVTEYQDQLNDTFKPLYDEVLALDRKHVTVPEETRRGLESEIAIVDFWITYRVYNREINSLEMKNHNQGDILKWRNNVSDPRLINRFERSSKLLRQNKHSLEARYEAYYKEITEDYKKRLGVYLCWARVWVSLLGANENMRAIPGSQNIDFFSLTSDLIQETIRSGIGEVLPIRDQNGMEVAIVRSADVTDSLEKEFFKTKTNERITNSTPDGKLRTEIISPDYAGGDKKEEISVFETAVGYIMRKIDAYYESSPSSTANIQHDWQSVIKHIYEEEVARAERYHTEPRFNHNTVLKAFMLHTITTMNFATLAKNSASQADYIYYMFHWHEYALIYQDKGKALFEPLIAMLVGWFSYAAEDGEGAINLKNINMLEILFGNHHQASKIAKHHHMNLLDRTILSVLENSLFTSNLSETIMKALDKEHLADKYWWMAEQYPFISIPNSAMGLDSKGNKKYNFTFFEPPLRTMYVRYEKEEVNHELRKLREKLDKSGVFEKSDAERVVNILSYRTDSFGTASIAPHMIDGKPYTHEQFDEDLDYFERRIGTPYTLSDYERDEKILTQRIGKIKKYKATIPQLRDGTHTTVVTFDDIRNVHTGAYIYEAMDFNSLPNDKLMIAYYNDVASNVVWMLNNVFKADPDKFLGTLATDNKVADLKKMVGYCMRFWPVKGAESEFQREERTQKEREQIFNYAAELEKKMTMYLIIAKLLLQIDVKLDKHWDLAKVKGFLETLYTEIGPESIHALAVMFTAGWKALIQVSSLVHSLREQIIKSLQFK